MNDLVPTGGVVLGNCFIAVRNCGNSGVTDHGGGIASVKLQYYYSFNIQSEQVTLEMYSDLVYKTRLCCSFSLQAF